MILSPTDIATLRDDHPHTSRFYFSVFVPALIYTGTITGSPAAGSNTLALTDVSGSIAAIKEGMTIYVGTTVGGKDFTKRRYRSRVGNTITVDENTMVWQNGQYVNVYNFYELWSVYPFVTPTSPFTFYKDKDVAYSDQNDKIPPVAIGKGPYVGFLSAGSLAFSIDASDSYAMAAGVTISSYLWECPFGTIANPAASITTITFTSAIPDGCWLDLTVTDSNSKTQKIHIPVFVYDRTGANVPITQFSLSSSLEGDYNTGGYSLGIETWDSSVIDDIIIGAYGILWVEEAFKTVAHSFGFTGNVKFAGYVTEESIVHSNPGTVTFSMATINGILDKSSMTSVSIEEGAVGNWYTFPVNTLTIARAVHHLLRWHTTLFSITDVYLPVSNTVTMPACDDFEKGSIYTNVDNFTYQYSILSKMCSNSAGKIYIERNVNYLDDTARNAIDTVMTISDIDRQYEAKVNFRRNDAKISCVLLSGIAYVTGAYAPILSTAPGGLYADIGLDLVSVERQALASQAEANFLSGRMFCVLNQEVREITMTLAGNYPVDLVPQCWYTLTDMQSLRTNIDLEGIRAVCRHISYNIDIIAGTCYPILTFEPEAPTIMGDGDTFVPPVDPSPGDSPSPYTPPGPITTPNPPTRGYFGISIILPPTAGLAAYIEVPFNCRITAVRLVSDVLASAVVDIWKSTYTNFPPTNAGSITASTPPTLSSAVKMVDVVLSGWTRLLYRGDWLAINIDSASGGSTYTLSITGVGL